MLPGPVIVRLPPAPPTTPRQLAQLLLGDPAPPTPERLMLPAVTEPPFWAVMEMPAVPLTARFKMLPTVMLPPEVKLMVPLNERKLMSPVESDWLALLFCTVITPPDVPKYSMPLSCAPAPLALMIPPPIPPVVPVT